MSSCYFPAVTTQTAGSGIESVTSGYSGYGLGYSNPIQVVLDQTIWVVVTLSHGQVDVLEFSYSNSDGPSYVGVILTMIPPTYDSYYYPFAGAGAPLITGEDGILGAVVTSGVSNFLLYVEPAAWFISYIDGTASVAGGYNGLPGGTVGAGLTTIPVPLRAGLVMFFGAGTSYPYTEQYQGLTYDLSVSESITSVCSGSFPSEFVAGQAYRMDDNTFVAIGEGNCVVGYVDDDYNVTFPAGVQSLNPDLPGPTIVYAGVNYQDTTVLDVWAASGGGWYLYQVSVVDGYLSWGDPTFLPENCYSGSSYPGAAVAFPISFGGPVYGLVTDGYEGVLADISPPSAWSYVSIAAYAWQTSPPPGRSVVYSALNYFTGLALITTTATYAEMECCPGGGGWRIGGVGRSI